MEATNMTNRVKQSRKAWLLGSLLLLSQSAFAQFDSGSTGADGAFAPQINTRLQMPEDGIFNFTTVNIPSGVTVNFTKNTTNTPVIMLASGDVTIAGTLSVRATNAPAVGPAGGGNLGDDAIPGLGGPGGFDGGRGGTPDSRRGGNGLGPGGARGAVAMVSGNFSIPSQGCGGAGAGHASNGSWSFSGASRNVSYNCDDIGVGTTYGNARLQPLIGGSGGGGGYASTAFSGGGGGGGGGAILIASSGTVSITGQLNANGGLGGASTGSNAGGTGGSGSGGAIRIVANTIAGNGQVLANGGAGVFHGAGGSFNGHRSGNAGRGRVRLEANTITRTSATSPGASVSTPQPLFLANIPSVRITSVAGIATPASPSGVGDVVIPEATPNPVSIEFATTNIPVGNTVELTLIPQTGVNTRVTSNAITGTDESGTASISVDIPDGPSTLLASITFTVAVASLQQDYSQFAQGNTVEKVRVDFDPVKGSMTTFIASNGQEFTWPSNTVAFN